VTSPGSARVLRLAATGRPRNDRAAELLRLFGADVEVVLLVRATDARAVAQAAAEHGVRAVLAEVFRGDLAELRQLVAPVPVLRPMFERRPGPHAAPSERFAGYGRLLADGTVEALPDRALASPQ
jgi:hypothetical protein